jgi:hypothetical protein
VPTGKVTVPLLGTVTVPGGASPLAVIRVAEPEPAEAAAARAAASGPGRAAPSESESRLGRVRARDAGLPPGRAGPNRPGRLRVVAGGSVPARHVCAEGPSESDSEPEPESQIPAVGPGRSGPAGLGPAHRATSLA